MVASREHPPLDDTDRAILQILQRDARNATAVEIADHLDVSDATVRNRIEALEDQGIIEGYVPIVNYEKAGYQLEVKIVCTAPIVEREELTQQALEIDGVVEIQEVMTGRHNVLVTVVTPTHDDLTAVAHALDGMGLSVEREELLRHTYLRPFNHFGVEDVSGDLDGAYEM